ncbi:MAG: outer membrane protein [Xanthobacteraceae bacterium]
MGNTMKKLLLGSAMSLALVAGAGAADLAPVYSKAPPPAWSWTGFYVGVQGGAGWGTTEDSVTAFSFGPSPVIPIAPGGLLRSSYGNNGLFGGGTAGFNWQTGRVVFGVEGDISGANIDGDDSCTSSLGFGFIPNSCHTNLSAFGTATGRLGVTVDHALLYIKGGAAFGHFEHDAVAGVPFPVPPGGVTLASASISDNRAGFTVGTGIEYALWGGWSAKLEYDYMDFGTKNIAFTYTGGVLPPGVPVNVFADDRERVSIIRAGVNYRFDWLPGPLVTRY